jgi:hypothetical protein
VLSWLEILKSTRATPPPKSLLPTGLPPAPGVVLSP